MTEETLAGEVGIGHNSQGKLVSLVERIERLMEDAAAVREDIKEVFAEAKGEGFDTKTMRKAIAIRAMDPGKRQEAEAMLALYLDALGGV
jgi:uncharacterized protein (UPF0335 family)